MRKLILFTASVLFFSICYSQSEYIQIENESYPSISPFPLIQTQNTNPDTEGIFMEGILVDIGKTPDKNGVILIEKYNVDKESRKYKMCLTGSITINLSDGTSIICADRGKGKYIEESHSSYNTYYISNKDVRRLSNNDITSITYFLSSLNRPYSAKKFEAKNRRKYEFSRHKDLLKQLFNFNRTIYGQ